MTPKERAAKAIYENRYESSSIQAEAALSAIAEPSEAMIEDAGISMREAEAARYGEITIEDLFVVGWRAAHAAMMAEKDTGE